MPLGQPYQFNPGEDDQIAARAARRAHLAQIMAQQGGSPQGPGPSTMPPTSPGAISGWKHLYGSMTGAPGATASNMAAGDIAAATPYSTPGATSAAGPAGGMGTAGSAGAALAAALAYQQAIKQSGKWAGDAGRALTVGNPFWGPQLSKLIDIFK